MFAAFAGTLYLRQRGEKYVSTGLLLIGVAAFIGALRFSINPGLTELHHFVSALAACAGLPLMAVQYCTTAYGAPGHDGRMGTMGCSVVGFAAFGLAFPLSAYPLAVGGASMLVVLVSAAGMRAVWPSHAAASGAGAALFLLAGLLIGTEGTLGGLYAIDVYHLCICLACIALTAGLPQRATDW